MRQIAFIEPARLEARAPRSVRNAAVRVRVALQDSPQESVERLELVAAEARGEQRTDVVEMGAGALAQPLVPAVGEMRVDHAPVGWAVAALHDPAPLEARDH